MQSTNEESELLSARQAAGRLGVKLDTLYAYVSRGLLRSVRLPGSRERHYRAADIERFRAGRGADRARQALTPVIDSAICLIEDGRFYYRGADAVGLAETASLEQIAALLWRVERASVPAASAPGAASASTLASAAGRGGSGRGRGSHPPAPGLIERCQVRLAGLAAGDLAALDLTPAGVARTGATILAELTAGVADTAPGTAAAGAAKTAAASAPVHRQLAARWALDEPGADLVRRCLVLLADHELNASTFIARCVASTGATPYAVVAAALSALSGRKHGGASARAEALFREIGPHGDALAVMAARLARDDDVPGLGHPLYPEGDPRALAIVAALGAARPDAGRRAAQAAVAACELTGQHPNVDFALGAAVTALGLPPGSALGLFVVARSVGWIAHAIEQYEEGVLIRPRARYTGPRPAVAGA